jgi:hypothetical protein
VYGIAESVDEGVQALNSVFALAFVAGECGEHAFDVAEIETDSLLRGPFISRRIDELDRLGGLVMAQRCGRSRMCWTSVK